MINKGLNRDECQTGYIRVFLVSFYTLPGPLKGLLIFRWAGGGGVDFNDF